MLSKIIRILLIAAMLAGLGFLWFQSGDWRNAAREEAFRPDPKFVASSARVISELEITDLKGQAAKLPGNGQYRLINYWATWCGPCLEEMPLLNTFAKSQGKNDIMLIGIALDEIKDVNEYLKQTPANYPQFLETAGPDDSSSQLGNLSGIIPFTVLIGPDGRLLRQHAGPFADEPQLQEWLSKGMKQQ